MKIILHKKKLFKLLKKDKTIGFVPTMGGIHLGHISLIKKSIKDCDITIVSIFVNKQQFNETNDFLKYPRFIKKDISKLKRLKINFLYTPKNTEIYPHGINKTLKINSFAKKLCGKFRPGHFKGVVDVLDRFIKIIKPNNIYLGQKDMQQLLIVKDFIKIHHPLVKLVKCKTIRNKNNVALSTRNYLLSKNEKTIASSVVKILLNKKKKLIKKNNYLNTLKKTIRNLGVKKIDYLKVLDINKIIKPYKKKNKYKIFIAYYLGETRIIDNV